MFEAKWTGKWPCFCSGKWILTKDGVDISDMIPAEKATCPMNTYGSYCRWYFDDDWNEDWDTYEDGLHFDKWYEKNQEWVDKICANFDEARSLYYELQSNDWRYGSCGGCI